MGTLNCKYCVCKNVCAVRHGVLNAMAAGRSPYSENSVVISGLGFAEEKVQDVLARDCTQYTYKKEE
jgi:hypothetical protein